MTEPTYPQARTAATAEDFHGTSVADPYRWLEALEDPEVRAWISEQNRLTERWLAEAGTRRELRERLTELWDHPRAGAPSRRGPHWFQLHNSGLQNQDVLYVLPRPDAEGEVLLDPNGWSADGTVALAAAAPSRDGGLLAYAVSDAGSDWVTWRVREVASGSDTGDELRWSKFSQAAWLPDGSGFLYGRYPEPASGAGRSSGEAVAADAEHHGADRDQQLWLHQLGTAQSADVLVYARPDQPEWLFDPEITEDGRYLVLHVWHGTERRNRVFYRPLDAADPAAELAAGDDFGREGFVELLPEADAAYEVIGNDGPVFFVLTDGHAPRGRLVAIDTRAPHAHHWRELIPEGPDTLEVVRLVGGRFLAVYLHHAHHKLRRFTLAGQADGEIALPGIGTVAELTGRPDDEQACFTFTSFVHPPAVFRHHVPTAATTPLRPAGLALDPAQFVTEQEFVRSRDGTAVPVFLTRRRDVEPTGEVPALLWGYGGFGVSVTPVFRVWWLVWLERGGLLAVPTLRGGGEYGQAWHEAGRLGNKQRVFDDALAVAEWLVGQGRGQRASASAGTRPTETGRGQRASASAGTRPGMTAWTSPERLAVNGASNGGLLAAACLLQRPDLFGATVPEVGVLDLLRFHRFTIGWAWQSEFGSPEDPDAFRWLYAYSPLHNIRAGVDYPATLIVTGDHDDRVVPAHSLKFAAALQAATTARQDPARAPERPVLLRVETRAGHGAGKPTRVAIEERADVLTFLIRALGIDPAGR